MSIYLDQVLDYLDHHPVCQQADTVESVMKLLYDTYALHYNEKDLLGQFSGMPESFLSNCAKREQEAFTQGVVVGMLLMTEVNRTL